MTAQQLKNSILQMAVQGKLVPQDSNDEPASVLLERIRTEKEEMIKEGKIKKEKNPSVIFRGADNLFYEKLGDQEPACIANEVPFEIPDSWEWVRLKNIMKVVSARRVHQSDWKSQGIPFYRAREIAQLADFGHVNNKLFISKELYDEYAKSGVPQTGDLMVTAVGTLGKTYIVKENDQFYYKDASVLCFENFGKINSNYMQLVMETPFMELMIKGNSSGTTVSTITIVKANEYLVPLPPLNEQEKIVEKIQSVQAIIEQYNNSESERFALNESFPNKLKKSILQMAVQGKLVPQDLNDEPASVLLEKIRAEKEQLIQSGKIKRDKHESAIYRRDESYYEKVDGIERCIDDEVPFEIPASWEWTRIGHIFYLQAGKNIRAAEIFETKNANEYPCFGGNGLRGYVNIYNRDGYYALIGRQGALCGNINYARGKFYATEHAVVVDNFGLTNTRWGGLFLEALNLNQYATATAQPGLAVKNINTVLLPLPPRAEQERIVEAINQLFVACNNLSYS